MNIIITKTLLSLKRRNVFTVRNLMIFALFFSLSSCRSYREIPYFQDLNKRAITQEQINNYSSLTIQPDDVISVNVVSMNAEASSVFNSNNTNTATQGYTVNQQGEIKLPLVGTVKVAGLTTEQLKTQLQKSLLTYIKEPVVNVRVLNFKVSVLGDVARPNVYSVPGERITIPEALSLAGDLNITGIREILLIRENNGKREYVPIDLKSKALFNSPYYYMKNNDMLYVDPHKTKLAIVENSKFNVILSTLSIIAVVVAQAIVR